MLYIGTADKYALRELFIRITQCEIQHQKQPVKQWILTIIVAGVGKGKSLETLRFLCLNERNISLVAICAVI